MQQCPPLRLLASRTRHSQALDRPRLWCAATTAAGLIALGALATAATPAPASLGHSAADKARTATADSPPLYIALPSSTADTANSTGRPSPTSSSVSNGGLPVSGAGIPALVKAAYLDAQHSVAAMDPGCHLAWQVLAGIGQVESRQADNGNLTSDGTTRAPILGPLLNGSDGNASIPASGGGWTRAEGPMQFLPNTWAQWGADGNADGNADPNNIFDAALAAGRYLCADGRNLAQPGDLAAAILSYNHSPNYRTTVTAWISYYQDTPGTRPSSTPSPDSGSPGATTNRPSPKASTTQSATPPAPTGVPASPSRSASPTNTPGQSAGPTGTTSPSPSGSPAPTGPACSPTSAAPTGSGSASPTPTNTPTPAATPTDTGSGSASPSPTPTSCPATSDTASPASSGPSGS